MTRQISGVPVPGASEPATFKLDASGWVTAMLSDRTVFKSQSVEAHLLYAILRQMEGKRP